MIQNKNRTVTNLALTGLMGALVYVATMFFKVEIPVGADRTMIGFANVFCVLSGLILGPGYGGLAAGLERSGDDPAVDPCPQPLQLRIAHRSIAPLHPADRRAPVRGSPQGRSGDRGAPDPRIHHLVNRS